MKRSLLSIAVFLWMLLPGRIQAQTFGVQYDTVYANVSASGTTSVYDFIINYTHSSLVLKWRVVACTFPSDWLTSTAFGICDNTGCYSNASPNWLWDAGTSSGHTFTTAGYTDTTSHGTFDLQMNLTGASNGTAAVTVNISDPVSLTSRTVTFIISRGPVSVSNFNKPLEDVELYPNPAANDVNVVYDAGADIRNIAVYNIIGKVMAVYKVSGNSANLNLEAMPSGVYFVRLMNSNGQVVSTRKFTKQ